MDTENRDSPRDEFGKSYKSMLLRSDTRSNPTEDNLINKKRNGNTFENVHELERYKKVKPRKKYCDKQLQDSKDNQREVDQKNSRSFKTDDNKLMYTERKDVNIGREQRSKIHHSPRSCKSFPLLEHASENYSKFQTLKLGKMKLNDVDKSKNVLLEKNIPKLDQIKLPITSQAKVHKDYSLPVTKLTNEATREQQMKEKLKMETNLKITEILENLAKPPKKVDILTIKNLSRNIILNSFHKYKPALDECFLKNSKNLQIKGYKGINHYMVMSLLDHEKQLDMMNKLRDAYESAGELTSTYVTLYANAMMPEWIICLFMDEHKLTREQAINQIKAQEAYSLHLEEEHSKNLNLCIDN